MARHRVTSVTLFFAVLSPGFAAVSFPAVADDVPESLRIERNALKAYSQKPVVPIDRGNAHHRDTGSAGSDDVSRDRGPTELPNATVPSPAQSQTRGGVSQ